MVGWLVSEVIRHGFLDELGNSDMHGFDRSDEMRRLGFATNLDAHSLLINPRRAFREWIPHMVDP